MIRKQSPDMIKIQHENRFKYIHERDVEALFDFLEDKWMVDSLDVPKLMEALETIKGFLSTEPFGELFYVTEDGKKQELALHVDREWVATIMGNLIYYTQ